MKRLFASAMVLSVLTCGCAAYSVRVTGYLDVGEAQRLPEAASMHVVEDEKAADRALERDVAAKIERLLRSKGYTIAPAESADYQLLFEYAASGPQTVWETRAVACAGCTVTAYEQSPPIVLVPYARTVYTRRLTLRVIEAAPGPPVPAGRTVWRCEAASTGNRSDLASVIDYLLVAAFEHFGEDTEGEVIVRLGPKDPGLQALRQ